MEKHDGFDAEPDTISLARLAWEARKELDAEIVKNHCPSHRLIGNRIAEEIMGSD